jgi:hypothetical protein
MKRLCLLLITFLVVAGCSADGPKQQWADFKQSAHDDIILKPDFTQARQTAGDNR